LEPKPEAAQSLKRMLQLPTNCGGIEDLVLGVSWDAATLARQVDRRAAVLAQNGIGQNSILAIAHGGTAHFFADLFAVWKLGATAACLDSTLTAKEIANVVEFAKADAILLDGRSDLQDLSVPIWNLDTGAPPASTAIEDISATIDDVAKDETEPALLLFTSGTTGTPKGVVLSAGALARRIQANILAIGASKLSRALVTLPTFFGHGLIGNSLTPLFAGGIIILHPRGMALMNNLGALIDQHRVTFMSSVPSLWRLALTASEPPKGTTLQRVHVGSAPLSAGLWSDIAKWTNTEVVNCYGITETANWIGGASSKTDDFADGLVGRMWGGEAGVITEDGAIASQGDGEIVIRSGCVMSGYLKREDLTQAAFKDGWFRTGDHGSIDKDHRIWITGRLKDEINRGGFKVQPAELDTLLESHPAVAEACAFGVPDPTGGEAVAAAIKLQPGKTISAMRLQSWCAERLRRAAVPEHWFFVPEIPRTPRGKVSRDVVRRMLTEDGASQSASLAAPGHAVVIAATFNVEPLLPPLRFALEETNAFLEVKAAPYNQVSQQLKSASSELSTNLTGYNVVLLRFEDFVRDIDDPQTARDIITKTSSDLIVALAGFINRGSVTTLLVIFPNSGNASREVQSAVLGANQALSGWARTKPKLALIPTDDIDRWLSGEKYDSATDTLAHIPFTDAYYASIAIAIAKKMREATGSDKEAWPNSLSNSAALLEVSRQRRSLARSLPGAPTPPATERETELLTLWETIIGVSNIGVTDDFFELGGTSLMAARLVAELARNFAVTLPLATIVDAPTIRQLADRLDHGSQATDALVTLRGGGNRQMFFVHDGVGETLLYRNLAQRLPRDISVIAIEPHRAPNMPIAFGRIEDIAGSYVGKIREQQPHGPYLLGGMCAGGVIAYEMAAQLEKAGERVDLVTLLDAPAPSATRKAGRTGAQRRQRMLQALQGPPSSAASKTLGRAATIAKKVLNAARWEIYKRAKDASIRARFALLKKITSRGAPWPAFVPGLSAQEILNSAQASYAPRSVATDSVVLVRAKSGEGTDTPYVEIYNEQDLGWGKIARQLKIVDVEGGHSSMLQEPFVKSLAAELTPYITPKVETPKVEQAAE
jgi:oxalate---CoA ligase